MEGEMSSAMRKTLLMLSCILLITGNCGGPIMCRLYFINGGKRIWLSAFLQSAGFPITLIPLIVCYFNRRKIEGANAKLTLIKLPTLIAAAVIGIIFLGLGNYMIAFAVGHLPVSTSTLISSTILGFTAFFSFLLVKQKFTPYSINAIVLLTMGAVVLGIHASSDKPEGESNKLYIFGFLAMVAASTLCGLYYPLLEFIFTKTKQKVGYAFIMEVQLVIAIFATAFATVGMLLNNDFKVIPREAKEFQLGEAKYYVVLIFTAIVWQGALLGIMGVIFTTSSLVGGVTVTVLLPITEVLGVIFYHENFGAEKGVALVLSLWGFVSYFYGEIKQNKKKTQVEEKTDMVI